MNYFEDQMEKLLEKAEALGASYAGVLYQRRDSEIIEADNKALKSYNSRSFSGLGVRVVHGGALGYASTSDMSREGLEICLEQSVKAARAMASSEGETLKSIEVVTADVELPVKVSPFDVPPEEKVSLALDANEAAWNSDSIRSTMTRLGLLVDERIFKSSDGASVRVVTPLLGFGHASVAEAGGVKEVISDSRSMCAGYEFIKGQDWNGFASEVSDLAVEAVASKTAPPGTYPVVVDQDVVGLVLHEALGHATEGDIVATGGSVLMGRLGTRIASDPVTIIDEGVVEGGYYYPYDDEGAEKGKTVLVENGMLKGYLTDRRSASRLDMEPTGNGRSQDFENFPIVRQTNYYMEPGDHSLEELVEGVDLGILVQGRGMRGGQVETGMGTFTFGVGPSRMIRDGEVQELVRGVVISGSVLDVLKTVDAIGDDFKMRTSAFGGCGKNAQQVKAGMGGPSMRAQKMTVGGQ
jgi:TldD protein